MGWLGSLVLLGPFGHDGPIVNHLITKSYKNLHFMCFSLRFSKLKSACGRATRQLVLVFLWGTNSGKVQNDLFHEKLSYSQNVEAKIQV